MKLYGFWLPIILLSFLGLTFPDICNCTDATDKVSAIDGFVTLYAEHGRFNGTVLVAENGEMIFKKGYGLANMEWNIMNE